MTHPTCYTMGTALSHEASYICCWKLETKLWNSWAKSNSFILPSLSTVATTWSTYQVQSVDPSIRKKSRRRSKSFWWSYINKITDILYIQWSIIVIVILYLKILQGEKKAFSKSYFMIIKQKECYEYILRLNIHLLTMVSRTRR